MYNNANLPYARATTAKIEAETATIEANVCGSEENTNLTRKGKLLLLWHQWLGHASFRLVRWLSRQGYLYGGMVDRSSDIICDSCRIAQVAKRQVEKRESSQTVPDKKIAHNSIKSGDLKPGDRVSMDQYSSTTRGRLMKGHEKAPINETYGGGTILWTTQVASYMWNTR